MKQHLTLLSFIIGLLSITLVMAWPYQLNLSNGALYDTNASNNATTNFTIYVETYIINNTINQTIYLNQTNITCVNCTYTNYTNYTYYTYVNGTNGTFYNKSEDDARFLTLTDFTGYKNSIITTIPRAEFDALVGRVNAINITDTGINNSHGGLWGGMIIGWLLTAIVIYFILKSSGGIYETLN